MAKVSLADALKSAQSHLAEGRFGQARQVYQAILKSNPGNPAARRGLERVESAAPQAPVDAVLELYRSGELARALSALEPLIANQPNEATLWNLRGGIAMGLRDLAGAEAAFRKVTQLKPTLPDGHNNLGQALHQQGQHADAEKAIKVALSL